jgi:hypothetical protein
MDIAIANKAAAFNDLELRGYLHSLIEKMKDRTQLLLFVNVVETIVEDKTVIDYENEVEGWSELSLSQQTTLKLAIEESNHPHNLVPHEDVLKMMDQWLTE